MTPTETSIDVIGQWKELANRRCVQFAYNMEFIPDDKLNWKPNETSKSAFEIWTHCIAANHVFASLLSGGKVGDAPMSEEMAAWEEAFVQAIQTRAEAKAKFSESLELLARAYDAIDPAELDKPAKDPFGLGHDLRDWLDSPMIHIQTHRGQVDYLQTMWDDQEFHWLVVEES